MTTQRVRVQIDSERILQNYRHIQSLVPQDCKVLAVVKADAYGHGAKQICKLLEKAGCTYFAVACIEEAIGLRQDGVKGNLLILGNTDPSYAEKLRELNLIQTVDCLEYAKQLSQNGGARIHIKVDTGMSRLGFYCHHREDVQSAADLIEQVASLPDLQMDGIFTHFADSDGEQEETTYRQFDAFQALLNELEKRSVSVGLRHCCNSAAILRFPQMCLDMVRAGLILYGLSPSPYAKDNALQPAMRLISRVSAVNHIRKGDAVSYGGTYVAKHDMYVAVLSIGYADGLPRALSGNLTVKINGQDAPLIGRICMDLCMADLGDNPCKPGDEAVIFETAEQIEDIARKLGSISYEVLCLLKRRVAIAYQ